MGVSSTTNTEIYSGDGSTVSFPFPFYFFRTVDLPVYVFDTVAKTITPQTLGVDFTVSGTPNAQGLYPNGGAVVFGVAPTSTEMVIIPRTPTETQTFALIQNGTISANALVQQFDYLTLLVQSLQDQLTRCLKVPVGYGPAFNTNLPVDLTPDYNVSINGAGNGLAVTLGGVGPAGPTGPTGPAGAAGTSSLVVSPLSATGTLTLGSPVNMKYVPCDATAGVMTVNLPAAVLGAVGQVYQIKKVDSSANVATIAVNGSDVILGTAAVSSLALDFQGKSYTLVCRAAGFWDIL